MQDLVHYLSAKVKLDNVVVLKDSLVTRIGGPVCRNMVDAGPGRESDATAGEVILDQLSHLSWFCVWVQGFCDLAFKVRWIYIG